MKNTKLLKDFLTDEQILEVLVMYENNRKMDSAKTLASYVFPKWNITTLEAFGIMQNIAKEFNIK